MDAADDVFAVAWRRLNDVPEGEAALRWLYGVSRNVPANRRRSPTKAGQAPRRAGRT